MFNNNINASFFPMNLINIAKEVIHIAVDDIEKAIAVPRGIFGICTKKGLKNKISEPLQKYIGIPTNTDISIPKKPKFKS